MKNRRLLQLIYLASQINGVSCEKKLIAVAVIATEMKFRPLHHRLIENIFVLISIALGKDVRGYTVGISQVSIRHYLRIYDCSQFQAFTKSLSAAENVAITCLIISGCKSDTSTEVSKFYNGESSLFYIKALEANISLVKSLWRSMGRN